MGSFQLGIHADSPRCTTILEGGYRDPENGGVIINITHSSTTKVKPAIEGEGLPPSENPGQELIVGGGGDIPLFSPLLHGTM